MLSDTTDARADIYKVTRFFGIPHFGSDGTPFPDEPLLQAHIQSISPNGVGLVLRNASDADPKIAPLLQVNMLICENFKLLTLSVWRELKSDHLLATLRIKIVEFCRECAKCVGLQFVNQFYPSFCSQDEANAVLARTFEQNARDVIGLDFNVSDYDSFAFILRYIGCADCATFEQFKPIGIKVLVEIGLNATPKEKLAILRKWFDNIQQAGLI